MKKERRTIRGFSLFLSVLAITAGFFLYASPAKATIDINVSCDLAQPGTRYAVFGISDSDSYPPGNIQQKCILVQQGQTTVTFDDLVDAGLVEESWATPLGGGYSPTNVNYTLRHSCRDWFGLQFKPIDVNGRQLPSGVMENVEYQIQSTIGILACPNNSEPVDAQTLQQQAAWRNERYQLRIGRNQYRYLYPLGFFDEQPHPEGAQADCSKLRTSEMCRLANNCFWANSACLSKVDRTICSQLTYQDDCLLSDACAWNNNIRQCITALEQNLANGNQTPTGYTWALPPCAFEGSCRNVNDVLQVAVTYAKGIFGFLGTAGLLFFIYGGITIVMSAGSSDKVSKGKEIITAAVIGLIICFSAYIAVDFILDALQVGSEFRQIGTLDTPETK